MKIDPRDSLIERSPLGASLPRPSAWRLVSGRGTYTDDLRIAGLLHAAFVRSPHAAAGIVGIDGGAAARMTGVRAIFDGAALAGVCQPWTTRLATLPGHRSVPQPPLAIDRVVYQGQPVAIVIAESRAQAEDAAAAIAVQWREQAPVATWRSSLREGARAIHPALATNLALEHRVGRAEATQEAFAGASRVARRRFRFARHTGVALEPRALVAAFDPMLRRLSVHAATQVPHQMRAVLAAQLGLPEADVRIHAPDVGGGFGVKLHVYDDEMALVAAAVLLGRPVKWVADRMESFGSDVHARAHEVEAEVAVDRSGRLLGLRIDDVVEIGAYSIHPRSSALEGLHAITMAGAPYDLPACDARLRVAYQNKVNTGSYRGVGQPIACAVTEQMIDAAADAIGMDPAEFRRRNLRGEGSASGRPDLGPLTLQTCLDRLLARMDYASLRREQAQAREAGRLLGIGLSVFLESTAPGPGFYGTAEVAISAADGATLRIEPDGSFTCVTSVLDQGQGVEAGLAQLIASALRVAPATIRIIGGDTGVTAVGGGTFASRGLTIGGEAALRAAHAMTERLLAVAAAALDIDRAQLELAEGRVAVRGRPDDPAAGEAAKSIDFAQLARLMHYQPFKLPRDLDANPVVVAHWVPQQATLYANGAQASLIEVDPDTGMIRLLGHWIAEDCGRIVNPMLVEEQLRGGIVQGIGAALYEELRYDGEGQLQNATMADYLVPMAAEMPDIVVEHVETPVPGTLFGGKGVGEAGTIGAGAAVANAVNDALRPLGAVVTEQPMTPERILRALGKLGDAGSAMEAWI